MPNPNKFQRWLIESCTGSGPQSEGEERLPAWEKAPLYKTNNRPSVSIRPIVGQITTGGSYLTIKMSALLVPMIRVGIVNERTG
jgi:hypothetical protein